MINTLEKSYWDINKSISLEQYINPINIEDEKKVFFHYYTRNKVYNPQWQYKEFDFNTVEVIDELQNLSLAFKKIQNPISVYYMELIEDNIAWITNLNQRNNPSFSSWLNSLYGVPDRELLIKAQNILDNLKNPKKDKQTIKPEIVKETIHSVLKQYKFNNWKINIKSIPSRMSINQISKEISINKTALFSQDEMARLVVHEVQTHILRSENGNKQKYLLFKYGFPQYLTTEEGLALYNEEKNNLLKPYDMQKYALRVLATNYGTLHSFFELFSYLHKVIDFDDAFAMTTRIKRGLIDSSKKGAYTKDQVYLDGYLKVKELSAEDIKVLFCGKIGIENIKEVLQLIQN